MKMPSFKTALIWFVLTLPAVYLVLEKILTGVPGGRFFAMTGQISVWLMFAALFQTPAERLFRQQAWIRSLRPIRRHIGVAAFAYATLHLLYWLQAVDMGRILESFSDPVLITGWLPFFVMTVMAITSNDWSVRKLRQNWKPLQRVIYVGAPLVVLHWEISVEYRTSITVVYVGLLLLWATLRLMATRSPGRAA
jgi:sulfoxide reductase heme-binding subunit YedZ